MCLCSENYPDLIGRSLSKVFSRAGHYTSKILILSFQIFLGIYVLASC